MKSATFALILLAALGHARAATLTVTSKADSGPGTLREALDLAASGDTITFGGGVFSAPSGPGSFRVVIRLTSGPLPLKPVNLQGLANFDGSNRVVITGDADASGTPTAGDVAIFSATPSGAPAELTIECYLQSWTSQVQD